ncbi:MULTISPECIES: BTAD domain-containing putative transcriptional regulator [unclassified Crossiella]|uniref:AfsR/SARP family transcriptional regulator n=1 Tax=unclassified Crossiella TaxID=2620835 RepID=UPI001FFEF212|nr:MULTISPECIES: BTAD domain-containing putative transcriptional regulator [unclassified Crossiella]MCK2239199.1 NB-ARC domain-containing protein [Crossiella sp. S99.2]MCK2251232.1 NB-ARC domain-containing protein [Crossiella sp. S99.1]
MRPGLTFAVLGPVRAWHDGVALPLGSPQQRLTLVVLLLAQGRLVSTEEIAAALWENEVPRAARGTIRTYVHRLRQTLEIGGGEPVLTSATGGYALRVNADGLDLSRFQTLARNAEKSISQGDLESGLQDLHAARLEWQGEALAELPFEYAARERARLRQRRLAVIEQLAALEIDRGRCAGLLDQLAAEAAAEPLRERLQELLMLGLYRAGRQAEALETFDRVRRDLAGELGIDPGPALRGLHEQILRADPALLGARVERHRAQPPPPAQVTPAQLPADLPVFTGRDAELAQIRARLRPGPGRPAVVVVHGMPGVGKTTFAVRCAHELAADFPDGTLYVDLRGFEAGDSALDPADAVRWFLDALAVPTQHLPDRLDALTALYRTVLAERRCLILLDNARDTAQVLPLLPGGSRSLVLVTSRVELSGLVAGTGALTVSLDLLGHAEARQFLARRLGADRLTAEPEAVTDIITICGRLPLALAVVATRAAAHPSFSLAEVAAELAAAKGGLDAFTCPDSLTDVRTVLSWSYRALSAPAARLFRLLSLYPGPEMGVPVGASLAGVPRARAGVLMRELAAAHLVTEPRPGWYTWHDLLRAYAAELRQTEDSPAEQQAARRRGLHCHLRSAHAATQTLSRQQDGPELGELEPLVCPRTFTGHQDALDWFSERHGVLLSMIERAARDGFEYEACRLAWWIRHFLDLGGHWRDLEVVNETALHAAQRIGDKIAIGYASRGLARVAAHHGRYESARQHLAQALACFESEGDLLGRAYTHRQLIGVRQLERDIEGSLTESAAALELFRRAGNPLGEAGALVAEAAGLTRLGQHEQALESGERALALLADSGEPYDLTLALETVSRSYFHLGRYQECVAYRERDLAISRTLGEHGDIGTSLVHRMITSCLIHLGQARHAAGQHERAQEDLRAGLASLTAELSEVYRTIGRYHENRTRLRDTVTALETLLAEPDTGADWYDRATEVLDTSVTAAVEMGFGAYILEY